MEIETKNNKTKRSDDGDEMTTIGNNNEALRDTNEEKKSPTKKIKFSERHDQKQDQGANVVKQVREATVEQARASMIHFLISCDPMLYVDTAVMPHGKAKWEAERMISVQVAQFLVNDTEPCGRFYRKKLRENDDEDDVATQFVDDDALLKRDYKLCHRVCSLEVFHAVARHWSHSPESSAGSHHLSMLFAVLRDHASTAHVPLSPLLLRLMQLAWDHQRYQAFAGISGRLEQVPDFAKPLLAAMHYTNMELLHRDPSDTGDNNNNKSDSYWGFVIQDVKSKDAFARIVCGNLFREERGGAYGYETCRSLKWACQAAQDVVVEKFNRKLGAGNRYALGEQHFVKPVVLELKKCTGTYYDFDDDL